MANAQMQMPSSLLIVDGTNIESRCRESFGRDDIDFVKFFAKVTSGTQLLHTHYFTAPYSRRSDPKKLAEQSGRFNVLRAMPSTTLYLGRHQAREIRCNECGHRYTAYAEKGTDVAAAIRLVLAAHQKEADRYYLLAGDNDYRPAMEFARSLGAKVFLGSVIDPAVGEYGQLMAIADLRHNCDGYLKIDQAFMDGCWRIQAGKKR